MCGSLQPSQFGGRKLPETSTVTPVHMQGEQAIDAIFHQRLHSRGQYNRTRLIRRMPIENRRCLSVGDWKAQKAT